MGAGANNCADVGRQSAGGSLWREAFFLAVVLAAGIARPAAAHDLRHEESSGQEAVVVRLFFSDGNAFSYERYEIYRVGEKVPFQVGRTDTLGRVVFIPDRSGVWRVRAFSEDGHGVDFTLSAAAGGEVTGGRRPLIERYPRVLTGLGLIFGLFGLANLYVSRRTRR